ncbi:MAG: lysozyme inhibitor LprI family protein [Pseudomonadota bacterium]
MKRNLIRHEHAKFLLVPLLFLISALSAADCDKAMTTVEMNECASAEQKRVEKKLNDSYKSVLKYFREEPGLGTQEDRALFEKRLVEAQRFWVKFREADCDLAYQLNASGTLRSSFYISCMQMNAERRIEDFKAFMNSGG